MQKQAYLSHQPPLYADGPSFIGYPVALPYSEEISTLHFHEQFEIGICNEGESIFLIDNEYYYVKEGDAIFIPPNVPHFSRSLSERAPCLCEFVYIQSDKIEALLASALKNEEIALQVLTRTGFITPPVLHPAEHPREVAKLFQIIRLCTIDRPHLDALIPLELASFLLEAYGTSLKEPIQNEPHAIEHGDDRISSVAEYLSIHYDQNDSVKALSQMCHLSESQLTRRFIKLFGLSPIAYKNKIRCHVGCELLYHTDLSLEEISLRLGFTSYTDFYRMFKKNFSLSPSEYRKTKAP